jgi:hypothetical protein
LTTRLLIVLPFVEGTVTVKMKFAGNPALGGAVGVVITSVGCARTPTVTVPDAVPAVGVVPVPVPVPLPAEAPTLAVTVADVDVVSTLVADPV